MSKIRFTTKKQFIQVKHGKENILIAATGLNQDVGPKSNCSDKAIESPASHNGGATAARLRGNYDTTAWHCSTMSW